MYFIYMSSTILYKIKSHNPNQFFNLQKTIFKFLTKTNKTDQCSKTNKTDKQAMKKPFSLLTPHHPSRNLGNHPKLTFGKFGRVGI